MEISFHVAGVDLGLADGVFRKAGAIVLYLDPEEHGQTISLYHGQFTFGKVADYRNVGRRMINSEDVYAAIFPKLSPGLYTLTFSWKKPEQNQRMTVSVQAGEVTEVDWR